MRLLSLVRTQAFRIVLVFTAVFVISVLGIVWFIYWNTARVLNAQTDQIIAAEVNGLLEHYERQGQQGLVDVVIKRSVRGGQGLYYVTDRSNRSVFGNIGGWPNATTRDGDFIEFTYQRNSDDGDDVRYARGRIVTLPDGSRLLVARDVHERTTIQRLFTTTLPWLMGVIVLLGLVGGGVVSRRILVRLDGINRTSRDIMAGDLTRRVRVGRTDDEFDTLATNLNRMLDRIERLMRGMREVTDSVAHDLRSPLNRLRCRLEALHRRYADEDAMAEEIGGAIADADHLIATFNALLLIAEADAGTVREAMTVVDLTQVAEDVAELYAPVAEEKGIALTLENNGAARVEGNRRLISQAAANLLDNAIKYTPSGGGISLSARDLPAGAEFRVADTGPGIPEADRPRVLERFVRLEESRSSPGTGLGLSLVAAVARMHNALFVLEDNRPGLRAILRFTRPRSLRVPMPAGE